MDSRGLEKVNRIVTIYLRLREVWRPFVERINLLADYVAGQQMKPELRDQLRNEGRPALVWILLRPMTLFIAGLLKQNQYRMKAYPKREGDEERADMHTVLVGDYAVEDCRGYEEISKAAMNAAFYRIGWLNNYWTTKTNPQGDYVVESVDPRNILFEDTVKKKDQSDWNYYIFYDWFSADQILSIYADSLTEEKSRKIKDMADKLEGIRKEAKERTTSWYDRATTAVGNFMDIIKNGEQLGNRFFDNMLYDATNGRYAVIEFHERRSVVRHWVYSPLTDEKIPIPDEVYSDKYSETERNNLLARFKSELPDGRLQKFYVDELWTTPVCPTLLPDDVLFEHPDEVQGRGFQHKPVFCYDFNPGSLAKTTSVIDDLIDPQDSFNQRRMSFLEYLMKAVNPDIKAPVGSIPPSELDEWKSKKRGKLLLYNPTGSEAPAREGPLFQAQGLDAFAMEDKDLIEMISGINANVQGRQQASGETGILYARRVQQTMIMLSYFLDQVQYTQKLVFDYCDATLQKFMTIARMVRLLDKETGEHTWLELNWETLQGVKNDITQGKYDFKADVSQMSPTSKQMRFIEAMEFLRTIPPDFVNWEEIFNLWDSPNAKKLSKFAGQKMQQMQMQRQQQGNMEGMVNLSQVAKNLEQKQNNGNGAQ